MKKGLLALFIAGILLVVFISVDPAIYISVEQGSPGATGSPLGRILEIEGDGLIKAPQQDFFHAASKGQSLLPLYKLITGFDSQILVDLGEKFWLLPNSQIKIDATNHKPEVHLLSGRIRRLQKEQDNNFTSDTVFYVAGTPSHLAILERAAKPELATIPLAEIELEIKDTLQQVIPPSISEQQIHETFSLQKRFIEKCFISHYSRLEGVTQSGKVWVRFLVDSTGNLSEPIVTRSDFSDQEFHSCLLEIVARVRLKSYDGPATKIEFPIAIQLPE